MLAIRIESALGVATSDVLARRHNLWIGVSDTPWFQADAHLEALLRFGLEYTRKALLVFVPGRLYAVNANHVERKSRAKALRAGFESEDRFRRAIRRMLATGNPRGLDVAIADYDDILSPGFVRRRKALYRAFSEEGGFYRRVLQIAEEYLKSRQRTVTKERLEAIALYQLQELPAFLAPLHPPTMGERYEAVLYPGLGTLDVLARDLVEGKSFPDLTERLQLTRTSGIINIVAEEG